MVGFNGQFTTISIPKELKEWLDSRKIHPKQATYEIIAEFRGKDL